MKVGWIATALVFTFAVVASIVAGVACQKSANYLTYKNTENGVTIQYPDDWTKLEGEAARPALVAFASPEGEGGGAAVNLAVLDWDDPTLTLDDLKDETVRGFKETVRDLVLLESGLATLSGVPSVKWVLSGKFPKNPGAESKLMQVAATKAGKVYIVSYAAEKESYPTFLPVAETMIRSFQITDSGQSSAQPAATSPSRPQSEQSVSQGGNNALFTGSWRIYSAVFYYDAGGAGAPTTGGQRLELSANGTWRFGSSSGRWSISPIVPDDWKRWGVDPYGTTRKITLSGWSGGTAGGPVEESPGRVDFIWVIYHQDPPVVADAGTAWLKFGH